MESGELLKRVRKIEIRTRKITQQIFSGQYHSAFKGKGMAFSEVREYQYGDDIRNIDWNVTARLNHPYIKVFEEERELTVMLLIDVSGSNHFGTRNRFKSDLITELAAVLSFSAIANNDKVGVIFFSNKIEKYIPPKKGRSHILRIIRELVNHEPTESKTDIAEALRYLTNIIKKKCTTFILSDFINCDYDQALRIASNKHDIVALQVVDPGEKELPTIGLVQMKDPESAQVQWIDTANHKTREAYKRWWIQQYRTTDEQFIKAGIDHIQLSTNVDYVKSLTELFKRRGA
ncbi:MAG: hypothetical protein H6Q25_1576 [Bacteroidetes bacterium]|nr:hypothetical protein [Bacteroidota bacterium]